MKPEVSLVPASMQQELAGIIDGLLTDAQDAIMQEYGNVVKSGESLEAEITQRMLVISEQARALQKAAQGCIVAYIARKQLWRIHPDDYHSLRQFLRGSGLAESAVSDLNALGEVLVPYCDSVDIEIDPLLAPQQWCKLKEAIPAIRRAIRDGDAAQVQDILDTVKGATDRDAVRVKYRQPRTRFGHGSTGHLGDGRVLLVAILDDNEAAQTIVRRMEGGIEWDLVLGMNVVNNTLKVVVDNG